jgi:pilus assembly protein Flp/PilA
MGTLTWLLVFVSQEVRAVPWQRTVWRGHMRLLAAQGQGLVEYAVLLVLVAVVVIGILTTMGGRTSQVFNQVNCTLGGGDSHQDNGNGNSNKCK